MKIYEKCDKRKGYWKMYECTKERKEYRTKYNRFYRKKRKEEDPLFRLSISIRNRISESIYRMGYTKNSKTYKILGCDFKDFKFYIESKFVDNMSWDNYGRDMSGWQLDHIIPISSAKSEKEVIELNHYSNFQPLWAIDNIKKSNKLTYLT